ncbi:MAG: hypothetical protein EBQ94_02640 [Flavobacteriales bacterium]|jgi:hypothetical protein|nr:hypothetical protein [Flavobacteriales bacterium]
MTKMFNLIKNNTFKLNEIDFNRGPEQEPDPFKNVPNQLSGLRMNKPKGPELRIEKYKRIVANVDFEEINEMRNWIADKFPDIDYAEVVALERWEVLEAIDEFYDEKKKFTGLEKWKKDNQSKWEL